MAVLALCPVSAPWDQPLLTSVIINDQDWFVSSDDFESISASLYPGQLSNFGEFSGLIEGGAGVYNISIQYNIQVGKWAEENAICLTDDRYENNDSSGLAKALKLNERISAVVCSGNEDWFYVSAQVADKITVVANFAHVDGDVELALFDPSGNQVDSSTSSSNEELLSHTATQAGRYSIQVRGYSGAENRYSLLSRLKPSLMFKDGFDGAP